MKRSVLGCLCGAAALAVGIAVCFLQADNFEEGARLQGMQVELEWYERRISGLRSEISRFEFMGQTQEEADWGTQASGADVRSGERETPQAERRSHGAWPGEAP